MSLGIYMPLGMLVAKWVPTPCYNDAYSVGTRTWALWVKGWLKHCKTMISPFLGRFFLVSKRTFYFLGGIRWILHIGRARHPGPGPCDFTPGQLSVEFINIGSWPLRPLFPFPLLPLTHSHPYPLLPPPRSLVFV